MSQQRFATYNGKRYMETRSVTPILGDLLITIYNDIVKPKTQVELTAWIYAGAKRLEEVPLFTEHTLSSVMLRVDNIIEDRKARSIKNRTRFVKTNFDNDINASVYGKTIMEENY